MHRLHVLSQAARLLLAVASGCGQISNDGSWLQDNRNRLHRTPIGSPEPVISVPSCLPVHPAHIEIYIYIYIHICIIFLDICDTIAVLSTWDHDVGNYLGPYNTREPACLNTTEYRNHLFP